MNCAETPVCPRRLTCSAIGPSVAPTPSISVASSHSSIFSLTPCDQITPDEITILRLVRSSVSPRDFASSSASIIGRANASPTMIMHMTRSRATVRQISIGSNERFGSVTQRPPSIWNGRLFASPAVCISGDDGITTGTMPFARSASHVASTWSTSWGPAGRPSTCVASIAVRPVPQGVTWQMTPFGSPVVPPVYMR